MANNQKIQNRTSLKSLFVDGIISSHQDFSTLIDSVLVRRDDQFFGKWVPGISYNPDDIVFFNHALYVLLSSDDVQGCNCGNNCCNDKNPEECCCWQPLQLNAATGDDGDWVRYDDHTMYAKVFGKVGIGTGSVPKAFLHLNDAPNRSQLMFNPTDSGAALPMLKMTKEVAPSHPGAVSATRTGEQEEEWQERTVHTPGDSMFVTQQFEGTVQGAHGGTSYRVTHKTDTLGFLFKRKMADTSATSSVLSHEEMSLMFITSTPNRPRVGIGTTTPEAALDLKDIKGQIILDPGENRDPQIVLINLHPAEARNYLTIKVGATRATFATDAPDGFAFRRGAAFPVSQQGRPHLPEESEKNLVVIDGEGDLRAHGIFVEPLSDDGRSIHEALKTVSELEPRRHREGGERQFGFTAENVREVLPHAWKKFPDNTEGIAYHDLVVLLVKAVQELSDEVNQLKRRLRNSD